MGLSKLEDVAWVEILDKRTDIIVRMRDVGEAMETAVYSPVFLIYSLGEIEEEDLFIITTYYLKNGGINVS